MGGMTAIEMWHKLKDEFKLCIALDPYFRARATEIESTGNYVLDQPLLITYTIDFDISPLLLDYDSPNVHEKFFNDTCKHNQKNNYDLLLKDSGHLSYLDAALRQPSSLRAFNHIGSISNAGAKMEENYNIMLAFLTENDFLPIKFDKTVLECHDS